jgi:hypothetical protein
LLPVSEKFGNDVSVSPGELAGVGAYECGGEALDPVTTHGDPIDGCGWNESSEVGVVGRAVSLSALVGGDLVSFEELLPYEFLDSSTFVAFFSNSLDFSLSRSLSC